MRSVNRAGGFAKIFFLLVLIVALVVGGLIWLDFLGIIEAKDALAPFTRIFGVRPRTPVETAGPDLLDADRLGKERESLTIRDRDLDVREGELVMRESEINQKLGDLEERERALEERQKSLSEALKQYENKVANLEQTALYLANMPPEDAVAIMDEMDVNDLVDLLRTSERLSSQAGEASLVAFWLSLMGDRKRAAEIQRKMVIKPGPDLNG